MSEFFRVLLEGSFELSQSALSSTFSAESERSGRRARLAALYLKLRQRLLLSDFPRLPSAEAGAIIVLGETFLCCCLWQLSRLRSRW